MKKKIFVVLFVLVLIIILGMFLLRKSHIGDVMDGPGMVNETSPYLVKVTSRNYMPGEDVYLYDRYDNLVLSLVDENQSQYLFALYGDYVVLDSGTSASHREMLVYNIPSGKLVYETDYYPGENGLVLNGDNITFYKEIPDALLGEYILPNCQYEYNNGYIKNYGYTIGKNQVNDLGDIQCAYFE